MLTKEHPTAKTLAPTKPACAFDTDTREYHGQVTLHLDTASQSYPMPEGVVQVAPPGNAPLFQKWRLNAKGTAWDAVPDFRQVTLYDKANGMAAPNRLKLGDGLPANVTASQPIIVPTGVLVHNEWDDVTQCWRLVRNISAEGDEVTDAGA